MPCNSTSRGLSCGGRCERGGGEVGKGEKQRGEQDDADTQRSSIL